MWRSKGETHGSQPSSRCLGLERTRDACGVKGDPDASACAVASPHRLRAALNETPVSNMDLLGMQPPLGGMTTSGAPSSRTLNLRNALRHDSESALESDRQAGCRGAALRGPFGRGASRGTRSAQGGASFTVEACARCAALRFGPRLAPQVGAVKARQRCQGRRGFRRRPRCHAACAGQHWQRRAVWPCAPQQAPPPGAPALLAQA